MTKADSLQRMSTCHWHLRSIHCTPCFRYSRRDCVTPEI